MENLSEAGKYKVGPGSEPREVIAGPGSQPEARLGFEHDQANGSDKLDRLYKMIQDYIKRLDSVIGPGGYTLSKEGRVALKRAIIDPKIKEEIDLIEDVLISLYNRKEALENK